MRNSGIDIIGEVPWGTHFCQFYQNRRDLTDILVPYFKAGLDANEFCMWITSPDLTTTQAKSALRKAVPNLDELIGNGQIEILPHTQWYLKGGSFDLHRVMNGWIEKLNGALARGYEGLRLSGNTVWLEKKDWADFTEYERAINDVIGQYHMLALCTYNVGACSASEVLDVVRNHQFALVRSNEKWDLIEGSSLARARNALRASEEKISLLASFPELNPNPVLEIDIEQDRVVYSNEAARRLIPDLVELALAHPWLSGIRQVASQLGPNGPRGISREISFGSGYYQQSISRALQPNRIRVYGIDITQQKKSEEALLAARNALEAERDTLQAVMNGAENVHLVYIDRDFNFVRVNETYARGCGYRPEEMIGLNHFTLYPNEENEAIFKRVRDTGRPETYHDKPFVYPDQPERGVTYWDWTLTPVKNSSGDVIGLIFSLYETTERKKAEDALAAVRNQAISDKNRMEALMQALPIGVALLDTKGGNIQANPMFEAVWGEGRPETNDVKDYSAYKAWWVDSGEPVLPEEWASARAIRTGESVIGQVMRIQRFDGSFGYVHNSAVPIFDANGELIGSAVAIQDITARVEAEAGLRQNREWLRVTLASIGDAVIATDIHGSITFINAVAEELTGWPEQTALGREADEVFRIVNEETGSPCANIVKRVLDEGNVVGLANHTALVRRDGATVPIEDSAAPIRDDNGNVAGVVLVFHDVTEKRRTQQALRHNEQEMRLVMDSVPALIAYAGADMIYRRVNKGFGEMVGRTADQIVGHPIREIVGEEAWPRVQKELMRVYAGETVIAEHKLEYIVGRPWGQVILVPDRDASGRVQGHVVHIMNIDERKKAENELAEIRRRQAMILDSIADGFYAVDRQWRFIHINDAALAFFNATRESTIGRSIWEFFPGIQGSAFEFDVRKAMETGEPAHLIQSSFLYADRIMEFNAYPGSDNLTVLFRDVTERKMREEELHRLNRTLHALSDSDRAMMRATNEPGYLAEVCRIVVEDCGHLMVWIGYAEHDENKTIRPVAYSGLDEGYIQQLNLTWADNERGRGPTGTAVRTGKLAICRDMRSDPTFGPWREPALARGYMSSLVLPLITGETTIGCLTIYSREIDPFADEEINLLSRLADDLAYGITMLRVREAHRHAESELKSNLSRFQLLADTAGQLLRSSRPQDIVGSVCLRVMEHLDCQAFFNFLLDEKSGHLHMNAYAGISEEDAHEDEWLDSGTTISGLVARDASPIIVEHVAESTDFHTERIRRFGLRAYACQPMLGPGGKVIGTLSFGTRIRDTLSQSDISLIKAITDQVAVAMVRVRVEENLRQSQAELVDLNRTLEDRIKERTFQLDRLNADLERRANQLRALAQELTEAEERERRRLADILHDDLQQLLVGAKLHLGVMPGRWPDAGEMVQQVTGMLDDAIGKSRGLAQDLSPPLLRQQGLVATLEWLSRQMKNKYGLDVHLTAALDFELSEPLKIFLFRAAQEMLFNVVKHAGVSEASVDLDHNEDEVRLTVSDKGKGFESLDGLPFAWGTSGFGLFSIQERANLLGGRLRAETTPGAGSRFILEVPIENAEADVAIEIRRNELIEQTRPTLLPTVESKGEQPLRVLLADDHQVMRQGLAAMLFSAPDILVVGEAEDGRQVLDMIPTCRPDVIIMDVSMPIMDGIEATRLIKQEWPNVRVIGLSMFEEEDLARAMVEAGAESYLSKVLGLKEVVGMIRNVGVKKN